MNKVTLMRALHFGMPGIDWELAKQNLILLMLLNLKKEHFIMIEFSFSGQNIFSYHVTVLQLCRQYHKYHDQPFVRD